MTQGRSIGGTGQTAQPVSPMLTDLYQLTMAQAYYFGRQRGTEASFSMFFRDNPFGGGFAIAAGLEPVLDYLAGFGFAEEDLAYLRTLVARDGTPLFREEFLQYLGEMRFECTVDAVPEGTPVFGREPLFTVTGPIEQCQIIETTLLNIVNFSTLVATKAARCYIAAEGAPVYEFGLRRAQGPDGGMTASRAAYIGGCAGTSNVLAGQRYHLPVFGTHAHSWVMAFESEQDAFETFAHASPNNVILLVDTYDTLRGVERAIETAHRLEAAGHTFGGIRIDSGDLAWLSQRAREMLDAAGLPHAKIVASNELDEHTIRSLREQGARIDGWGVGTRLATAEGQSALAGVYKLGAVRHPGEAEYSPRIKVTDQTVKTTVPGVLAVRRYYRADGSLAGDMVYDRYSAPDGPEATMVDPADGTRRKSFAADDRFEELMVRVIENGERTYRVPPIDEVRERAIAGLSTLDETHKRFLNPHTYPVGLERSLYDLRTQLILEARGVE